MTNMQRVQRICDVLNKKIDEAENMEDIKTILRVMVGLDAISIKACQRCAIRIDKFLRGE